MPGSFAVPSPMNKPPVLIALGIAVVITWFLVIYRFDSLKNTEAMPHPVINKINKRDVIKDEGVEVLVDPFYSVDKVVKLKSIPEPVHPVKSMAFIEKPSASSFHAVYSGCIRSNGSELAIIHVNGSTELIKLGEQIEDFRLVAVYPDSAIFINGQNKMIVRK